MRRAPLAGAALAVLTALAACGGDGSEGVRGTGALSWTQEPRLLAPESRPGDRILFGEVRNDSLRPVRILASDVRVIDSHGRPLVATAVFMRGFAHGLYGSTDPRRRDPGEFELTRLGRLVRLKPGQTAPLIVSWRASDGTGKPRQIAYGAGRSLPIP